MGIKELKDHSLKMMLIIKTPFPREKIYSSFSIENAKEDYGAHGQQSMFFLWDSCTPILSIFEKEDQDF